MNAKSRLSIKYAESVIEMNTTFAKEMRNPLKMFLSVSMRILPRERYLKN